MATKTVRRSSKPRREVSESSLPVNDKGELDLVEVLKLALTVPGSLSQCYNRFHRYSLLNIIMVWLQTQKMEPMATYNKWKTLDRLVIKGQRALFVNHPKFAPLKDPATGLAIPKKNGKGVEMKVVGFYPKATVFQLSQTDGPELVMPEVPEWDKAQAMKVLDLKEVKFKNADGNVQGYSIDRKFALNPVGAQPFKTMIHEWAHIVCGHTTDEAIKTQYQQHRGVCEFQAEATALLVCRELGVDFNEDDCRGYIQHWLDAEGANGVQHTDYLDESGELLVTNKVVREIFAAADKILLAGRKAHFDKLAEANNEN